jgi:hypothetical protein
LRFSSLNLDQFPLPSIKVVADKLLAKHQKRRLRNNTDLYNRAVIAAENFKEAREILIEQKRQGELEENDLKRAEKRLKDLGTASARLAQQVLKVSKLVQISPEDDDKVFDQLMAKEEVHSVEDKNHLLRSRIGYSGTNEDCQAIVVDTVDGLKILAQIFRYHAVVPLHENSSPDPTQYPGHVEAIRDEDISQLTGDENHVCYYTISSKWLNSGPQLISLLEKVKEADAGEITISPVRDFTDTLDREEFLSQDDNQIRAKVLEYLSEGEDSVAKFHLRNGATVGWVHINREAERDVVTINYVYNRETLAQNEKIYDSGKGMILVSAELQNAVAGKCEAKIQAENTEVPDVIDPYYPRALGDVGPVSMGYRPY